MDDPGCQTAAPGASGLESGAASLSSVAHSPLFKLPRELRDYNVYEYAFRTPPHQRTITKAGGIHEPVLLFTCKIVRQEAGLLFYGRQRLVLVIDSYDPAVMMLWRLTKEQFVRAFGLTSSSLRNYRHIGPRNWNNLKMMLRFHLAGKIASLYRSVSGSPTCKDEGLFVAGLFKAVRGAGHGTEWRLYSICCVPGRSNCTANGRFSTQLHTGRRNSSERTCRSCADSPSHQSICTLLESARLEHLALSSAKERLTTEA